MLLSLVFLSLVLPRSAPDFVDLAAVIGMLVSAVVGLTHMKAHRRIAALRKSREVEKHAESDLVRPSARSAAKTLPFCL